MMMLYSALLILGLILIGVSIPFCFLAGSIFFAVCSGTSMGAFASSAYYALDSYSLLALPLFMAAGTLIEHSGIAKTLVDLAQRMMRRVKGGMGATIPIVACFFGALSGSSLATTTTLSTMLAPRLTEQGWDKRYVAAFISAASPLGYMIPPNMNAIIFAKVSTVSVASLFLATVIPGLIWAASYILINRLVYKKWYHPSEETKKQLEKMDTQQRTAMSTFRIVKTALPAFLMPIIMLGGIYGGVFTATEAGAVGCLYALVIGLWVFRAFKVRDIPKVFEETGYSVGTLLMIFPMTMIFTKLMVLEGVPAMITDAILGVSEDRTVVTIIIILILFISGFFLDANVLLLVYVPLLLPTATAIGISQIQLAVIIFVAIGIGTITPPMAMSLFISSKLCNVSIGDMVRPLIPFLCFSALPILLLVSFVPAVSEWLPSLLM